MDLQEAIQEFEDHAYHHSSKSHISDKAASVALSSMIELSALKSKIDSGELARVIYAEIMPHECEQSGRWGECTNCRKVVRIEYDHCPKCGAKFRKQ